MVWGNKMQPCCSHSLQTSINFYTHFTSLLVGLNASLTTLLSVIRVFKWLNTSFAEKKKIMLNMDQRQDFKYRNKKQHYIPSSLKLVIPSMLNSEELVSSSSIAFWHLKKNQQVSNCLVKDTTWQPVDYLNSVLRKKKKFFLFFSFFEQNKLQLWDTVPPLIEVLQYGRHIGWQDNENYLH